MEAESEEIKQPDVTTTTEPVAEETKVEAKKKRKYPKKKRKSSEGEKIDNLFIEIIC
jgi:hypothetical protein